MMDLDLIREVKMAFYRESIESIIFEAELMASTTRVDPAIIINKYGSKLAGSRSFIAGELKSISKRLRVHQSKMLVYYEYVDQTILSLLKAADQKGLATSAILREYAPIRKIAMRNKSLIKTTLMMPLVLFVLITLVLNSISSKLLEARSAIEFSTLSLFIMDNFLIINFILLVGLIISFFYLPHKIPILSIIYQKLDSLLAISLAKTMYSVGLSTRDIIPMMCQQFNLKEGRQGKDDISELMEILGENKLLTPNDMADMELSVEYGQFDEMLLAKEEKKFNEAKQFGELVGDMVKNFSLLVVSAPIFQFVVIVMDLVAKSTSMAIKQ